MRLAAGRGKGTHSGSAGSPAPALPACLHPHALHDLQEAEALGGLPRTHARGDHCKER